MYNFSTETLFYYVSSCYSWPQITPRCDKSSEILSHGRDIRDSNSYYGLNSAASVWKVILTYSSVVFLNKHFSCRLRQENSNINSIHCILFSFSCWASFLFLHVSKFQTIWYSILELASHSLRVLQTDWLLEITCGRQPLLALTHKHS